ncbi:inosine/xanthosine triphosphatase [Candidatus Pacearchaeota archaeon]|nr:inosine/xanthosine triphosphatase [Candidatus Pacearchaeota archaeon]
MIVNVGSKNPVKVVAVREVFVEHFPNLKIILRNYGTNSGVAEQPMTFEEIVLGARNRAKVSFGYCDYSIGLESGLIPFPYSESGYADLGVCSIFDGKNYSQGHSGGFEVPLNIVSLILKEGLDLSQACRITGITKENKIGSKGGIVSLLTNARVDRKGQIKQAIHMAMVRLVAPEFYR